MNIYICFLYRPGSVICNEILIRMRYMYRCLLYVGLEIFLLVSYEKKFIDYIVISLLSQCDDGMILFIDQLLNFSLKKLSVYLTGGSFIGVKLA